MTSSEPIRFDEQGHLDEQYAQDTFHDFLKSSLVQLDVGGGDSMGSGDVKAEFEPRLQYFHDLNGNQRPQRRRV